MSIGKKKAGAGASSAPRPSEEQDVKIPVEVETDAVDETVSEAAAVPGDAPAEKPAGGGAASDAPAEAAGDAASGEGSCGMTEEEMVAAAIRAGEEAAEGDFRQQLERAREELASVRRELEEATGAKDAAEGVAKDAVDRAARLQADWENFRRRTAQERIAERERATEKLVCALLPVIDDVERAIAHARSGEMPGEMEQFVGGVDAVHTKMLDVLSKEGVEVIDPAGEAFDPIEHQAVGRVEDASAYDETVHDVYQKGYRMGDHVIRSAMVTVTYGGEKRPAPEPEGEGAAPDGGAADGAPASEE